MGPLWEAADLITPMAIRVAATLRIAEHIEAGATTDVALAERTGADPQAMRRLMRHLVAEGVFAIGPSGDYDLGPAGSELLGRTRDWLAIDGAVGRADLAFVELLHTVSTGTPGYPERYGTEYWDDLDGDEALSASFDRLMGGNPAAGDVVSGHDWSAVRRVVDVGGGNGVLLARLLTAYPHLSGVLVERPGPAAAATRVLTQADVADRSTVLGRSFFDPLPADADVYVLSRVLHDWDDGSATAILRRCAQAAAPAGHVLVMEETDLTGDDDTSLSTAMDLRMLVYCAGAERTLADLTRLADDAGLTVVSARRHSTSSLVLLTPRPARE